MTRPALGNQLHLVKLMLHVPLTGADLERAESLLPSLLLPLLASHPCRTPATFMRSYACADEPVRESLIQRVPLTAQEATYVLDLETAQPVTESGALRQLLMSASSALSTAQFSHGLHSLPEDQRDSFATVVKLRSRYEALQATTHKHSLWKLEHPSSPRVAREHFHRTAALHRTGAVPSWDRHMSPVRTVQDTQATTFTSETRLWQIPDAAAPLAAHWLHERLGRGVDGWLIALTFAGDNPTLGQLVDVASAILTPALCAEASAQNPGQHRGSPTGDSRLRRLLRSLIR